MTMKKNHFSLFTLLLLAAAMLTACSDLLNTESEMVGLRKTTLSTILRTLCIA